LRKSLSLTVFLLVAAIARAGAEIPRPKPVDPIIQAYDDACGLVVASYVSKTEGTLAPRELSEAIANCSAHPLRGICEEMRKQIEAIRGTAPSDLKCTSLREF